MPSSESKEYFLILGMEERRITAAVAKLSGNEITILGTGEGEWNKGDNASDVADIAISAAEKNLKESVLLEKVIFGLPIDFLENDAIKPEHLVTLKTIAKELDLKPSGFIEYPQAFAYYLESKEGSAPTLLLFSIGSTDITVSLIRVGKLEKNSTQPRSESFTDDITRIVNTFKDEILPSRILIYDRTQKENVENIREELLRFSWHKYSSFLHTPKVETLPENVGTLALVEAAGGSILKLMQEEIEESPPKDENFGFVKHAEKKGTSEKELETEIEKKREPLKSLRNLPLLSNLLGNISKISLPKLALFESFSGRKLFLIIPFIVLTLFLVAIGMRIFFYSPKAEIHFITYPISTSKRIAVLFTTELNRSSESNVIIATPINVETSGEKAVATTGKSKIGEAAKGEVTIYNKTLAGKTFPKGIILTTDSLQFSLDQDVNVASASDTGEGLTFGKITSKITAREIGPEGNIPAGRNFTFKDFPESQYYAKNVEKLTGGTSREVSSVSKNDQDGLLTALSNELIQKARQEITGKIHQDEKILDASMKETVKNKNYNKDVGAEAKELTLQGTLELSALVYKNSDITILSSTNRSEIPSGYTLDTLRTTVRIGDVTIDKKGDYTGEASITSYFIPSFDIPSLKAKLVGKSYTDVKSFLASVENVAGFEIVAFQTPPFFGNRLPLRRDNISISVVPR